MSKYEILVPQGKIEAKSFRELVSRIKQERDFWNDLASFTASDFLPSMGHHNWAAQQAHYISGMGRFWDTFVEEISEISAKTFSQRYEDFKSRIESSEQIPPYSNSKLGQTIKFWDQSENCEGYSALLYAYAISRNSSWNFRPNGQREQDFYKSFSLATFTTVVGDIPNVPVELSVVAGEEVVAREIVANLGVISDEAVAEVESRRASVEKFEAKIVSRVKEMHSNFATFMRDSAVAEQEKSSARNETEADALEKRETEFQNLKELYEAHLRLKHPATLWNERKDYHNENSQRAWKFFVGGAIVFFIGCGLLLMFFGDWVAASFVREGCTTGSESFCKGISPKGPLTIAVVLTLLTLALWYLRLQMKLFLSERHLSLDARERSAFAETYLALIQQGAISGEREAVVLQSLFRPTQDGIIHDDGGPDFAVAGILAKALERGK